MVKLLPFCLILLFFAFNSLKAQQVFSYLNASTGNEGQYIVDADTNIYMYHGNQIEKLDKNFNPIWVKTYDDLDFYSLLLSKTGSVFFIAKDPVNYAFISNAPDTKYIGKLDNAGNASWTKAIEHPSLTEIKIRQLLLDRNNNLLLSGETGGSNLSALLIKMDTLGNMLFFKSFPNTFGFSNVTILNDSSGHYKCVYTNHGFENDNVATFTYSETGDSIFAESYIAEYPQHYYITGSNYYKSRNDSDVFYSITEHSYQGGGIQRYITIRKYKKNSIIWNKKFAAFSGSYYLINSFDEDQNKNVVFTISPSYGPGNNHTGFFNMCFKLDSNGVYNGQYETLFSYNWWPPSSQPESAKLHFLSNNKYYYDVIAHNFPSNPLSVTFMDTTLITNCSASAPRVMTNSFNGPISNSSKYLITSNTPPYILTDITPTVSAIANFTINTNYCLALSDKELNTKDKMIEISPNPTHNVLNLNSFNSSILESTIQDVTGKTLLFNDNETKIDISKLSQGLYFIKVKTNMGEFDQKFIKE